MGTADGSVIGTTQIVDHGPASERWNLVLVAEGYQASEMTRFHDDARSLVDTLFTTPPFDAMRAAINVFRVDVSSTDSGADDPADCGGSGTTARTYFDASFCGAGLRRLLLANDATVLGVVGEQVPQWNVIMLLVNSTVYGGSGGQVAVFSMAPGAAEIGLHEMGHTAFALADEYESWAGCGIDTDRNNHPPGEPSAPNVTTNDDRATIKWGDLVLPSTPMPTTTNANCAFCDPQPDPVPADTVGAFEGAHYYHCGAWRPQYDCRMRALGFPFCAVCQRQIVRTLAPYLPITWSDWESLGGTCTGGPAVSSWAANRLDTFVVADDSAMWHRSWDGSSWSDWESLGGTCMGGPAAVSRGPDRIDAFAIGTDRALWHMWWDGASWSDWESLGGTCAGRDVAAASWAADRLDVFVVGPDSALWHMWWDGASWSDWESLGGSCMGGPAAVSRGPDRIDTFVIGTDSSLWHKAWDGASWSDWESLGGSCMRGPAASSAAMNRLETFVIGTDSALWHKSWDGSSWSGWESLGGLCFGGPASVSRSSDRTDAFVIGIDSELWHKWRG